MISSWSLSWTYSIFTLRMELNCHVSDEFHIDNAVERLYPQWGIEDYINRCFQLMRFGCNFCCTYCSCKLPWCVTTKAQNGYSVVTQQLQLPVLCMPDLQKCFKMISLGAHCFAISPYQCFKHTLYLYPIFEYISQPCTIFSGCSSIFAVSNYHSSQFFPWE
jgi:hypothetical protein